MWEFLKDQNIRTFILNFIVSTGIFSFYFNRKLTNLKNNFEIEKLEYQHFFDTKIQEQKIEYEKEIIKLNDVINKNRLAYNLKFEKDYKSCFILWKNYNAYYNLWYILFNHIKHNNSTEDALKIKKLISKLDKENSKLNHEIDYCEPFIDIDFHYAIKTALYFVPSLKLKQYISEYPEYKPSTEFESFTIDLAGNWLTLKNIFKNKIRTFEEVK